MSTVRLGIVGGLFGALFVLVAHPVTRPFVANGLWQFGPSNYIRQTPQIPANQEVLPIPQDVNAASLWMQEGLRRLSSNQEIAVKDLLTFIEVAQAAKIKEPTNAFWPQAEAAFQQRLGNHQAAREAWREASRLETWNDHQNARLTAIAQGLGTESGRVLGWHWALAYQLRSLDAPAAIAQYGYSVLDSGSPLGDRFIVLKNGQTLRDGARSREGGRHGWQLVESAAQGSTDLQLGLRDATALRFSFIDQLAQNNQNDLALSTNTILATNEAWAAFVLTPERERTVANLVLRSATVASLPGAFLTAAVAGLVLYLLSLFFQNQKVRARQDWLVPAALAATAAVVVFVSSRMTVATVFVTLVFAGLLVRPSVNPFPDAEFKVSKSLSAAAALLGIVCAASFAATALLASTPFATLNPAQAFQSLATVEPREVYTFSALLVAALIGIAQVWAFSRRRDPYRAVGSVLKTSAVACIMASLTLAVVLSPIAIALDKEDAKTLSQLVQNEPTYYLQSL